MNLASRLFVFFIVINSIVAFMGASGFFAEVNTDRAQDYVNQLSSQSSDSVESTEPESGITVLDYFNPLNIGWVRDLLGLFSGFFLDPIFLFATFPAPFSYMFMTLFSVLEIVAIGSFARGVAA